MVRIEALSGLAKLSINKQTFREKSEGDGEIFLFPKKLWLVLSIFPKSVRKFHRVDLRK